MTYSIDLPATILATAETLIVNYHRCLKKQTEKNDVNNKKIQVMINSIF